MNNETGSTLNKNVMQNTKAITEAGEKSENQRQKEKLSFGESDKGPYSMFLKIENREQGSTRPLMT